ncbi:AEC family transporter [Lachnospiraceae bacterium OttesenSCG-928-E19]|nr:AEC family transporter [Lachnospiraceae bacterium OttesenSCG-928-E19]
MNKIVFRIFMSVLIFLNSYSVDIHNVFSWENIELLLLSIVSLFATIILSLVICRKIVADKKRRVITIQGIYRSNLALYGIPVGIAIYGEGNQGAIAILVAMIVPLYNIIAEVLLSSSSDQHVPAKQMLKRVFSNPLVVAALLGLSFSIGNVTFPQLLMDPLEKISKVATPLAFIIIGGSLSIDNLKRDWKEILSVSTLRLMVIPAIVFGIAVLMGMRTHSLVALLGVFASPISVSSYTMARARNIASEYAGGLVAVTTVASIVTMFFWITILKYFNYI